MSQIPDALAHRFNADRPHLHDVAYRMLGSRAEADDAVQEAWLRLTRTDPSGLGNLTGWLTTVTARICIDMLRSRKARREELMGAHLPDTIAGHVAAADDPLAESIGPALLVVLDTLSPGERLAFVLHDVFALPFAEVAKIVGRSETATRQLASRARRRVRGATTSSAPDPARQRAIVEAFLAASRGGDFEALLAVLDPEVVLRADSTAVALGAAAETHGAPAVAEKFRGRATAARLARVGTSVGAAWAPGGAVRVAFSFTVAGERIVEIALIGDADRLAELRVAVIEE